jgi:ABC-type phosphate/phosphonate transport system permease subunit
MHLTDQLRVNEWRQVSMTILLILASVTAVDRLSRWARSELERGS